MRSFAEMKSLILERALEDQSIRAVLLNGSRANDNMQPDKYQDYDIVYVVTELAPFTRDHSWTDCFGKKILWQLPDAMSFGTDPDKEAFTYLMIFEDGNRIDLTLAPIFTIGKSFKLESLTKVWLDKDGMFENLAESSDRDYVIQRPSERKFRDICNEFWWICPYVMKGLLRGEIMYAKEMMDNPLRQMFMQMIEIYIGTQRDFSISTGKSGKFFHRYLSKSAYQDILLTYPNHEKEEILNALNRMIEIFSGFAQEVAQKLQYDYNLEEERNSRDYLRRLLNSSASD